MAASRLNGSAAEVLLREENDGGSIRVNGAETLRFLRSLDALGERPAGAVSGARGEEMLASFLCDGVWRRDDIDGADMAADLGEGKDG